MSERQEFDKMTREELMGQIAEQCGLDTVMKINIARDRLQGMKRQLDCRYSPPLTAAQLRRLKKK